MDPVQDKDDKYDPNLGKLKKLPLEIRNKIYEQFFRGNQLYIDHEYNKGGHYAVEGMEAVDISLLFVNRMISEEAATIMYNTIKVVVRAADIFGLRPKHIDLQIGTDDIWRFDPTKGVGDLQKNGETVYDAESSRGLPHQRHQLGGKVTYLFRGELYPHMFAKLRHVCLDLRLNRLKESHMDMETPALWLHFADIEDINTTVTVDRYERALYIKYIKRTKLFHNLVRILQNSPRIELLQIDLGVWNSADHIYLDVDDVSALAKRVISELGAAKIVEVFLEAGVCETLGVLTNVKAAEVRFHRHCGNWEEKTEEMNGRMAPAYRNKGRELEELIVRGFGELSEEQLDHDSSDESKLVYAGDDGDDGYDGGDGEGGEVVNAGEFVYPRDARHAGGDEDDGGDGYAGDDVDDEDDRDWEDVADSADDEDDE